MYLYAKINRGDLEERHRRSSIVLEGWNSQGFVESFPLLLQFFTENKLTMPSWLKTIPICPWDTREDFYKDADSPKMTELRAWLADKNMIAWQARYAARRLEAALPKMLKAVPESEREHVRAQFERVARSPLGMYALVDYVNFKGEGTAPTERYNGQGWGLLQVLQAMKGSEAGPTALDEFARAAESVLELRVRNSPAGRNEAQWLRNWTVRLNTYRTTVADMER